MSERSYLQELNTETIFLRVKTFATNLGKLFYEIYCGWQTGVLPKNECLFHCFSLALFLFFHWDRSLLFKTRFSWLYPPHFWPYYIYYFGLITSPIWIWGIKEVRRKARMSKKLGAIFESCGLKNNLGNLPTLVFDLPLDEATRKLRVKRAVLPLHRFEKLKDDLQSGLNGYIDEFRENRNEGTIDIIYSQTDLLRNYVSDHTTKLKSCEFIVGKTRAKELRSSLHKVPHLLVAGQTGGGKSTFLRQFIVNLYFGNKNIHFLLIDLKGGNEFRIFQNLPRVQAVLEMNKAVIELEKVSENLNARMKLLTANNCRDLEDYLRLPMEKRVSTHKIDLQRLVIVIDEAAEMFLAGRNASGQKIQAAKAALSQVARQGRSLGVNLVVATQRPDAKALDTQVKANLTGILCFQMANDISSMTVLGNGRATDLPMIDGRAIWKAGSEMIQVQTPIITEEETVVLFKNEYVIQKAVDATTADTAQAPVIPSGTRLERHGNLDEKC